MRTQLRGWAVWHLPGAVQALVFSVAASFLAVVIVGFERTPVTRHAVLTDAIFAAFAVASVELSMRLAWPRTRRDRISSDFMGVWFLPVALVLSPPYAAVVIVIPRLYLHFRVWRGQPVKALYSAASIGLAYAAASWVFESFSRPTLLSFDHLGDLRLFGALAAAAAAWWLVNIGLIAAVVSLTGGRNAVIAALRNTEGLIVDGIAICMGTLIALLWATKPVSIVLAIPPVLFMQHQLFSGLRQAVRRDLLTDVASPQFWRETAAREVARASASGSNLSILMIDIDHFKLVNDRYGHLAGDEVLAAVARTISTALRPGDLVGRLGGEEFAAILAGLNLLDAQGAAERLRSQVTEIRVRSDRGEWITVSVSVGVAEMSVSGTDIRRLLDAADVALYAAKAAGRNCVRVAGPRPGEVIDLTSPRAGLTRDSL
ncbi:MAG TPA: GGDEF domain-containing protein [Acidothermaceae bacterium]|nr:GGDEF domain-containing protein [Acidothermaceae bacterium]